MFEKTTIYLKKNKLMESDFDSSLRAYLQTEVTKDFKSKLFQHCEIAEGTTLGDIISFMENDIDFWADIVKFNIRLFIEESKNLPEVKKDTEIEFLELYYHIESSCYREREFHGNLYPAFHGIGFAAKRSKVGPYGKVKKGDRINYSVSLTPVNEIIHLPVKLQPDSILVINPDRYKGKDTVHQIGKGSYSLIGIIYGIFWELSFYGPPNKRNQFSAGLKNK